MRTGVPGLSCYVVSEVYEAIPAEMGNTLHRFGGMPVYQRYDDQICRAGRSGIRPEERRASLLAPVVLPELAALSYDDILEENVTRVQVGAQAADSRFHGGDGAGVSRTLGAHATTTATRSWS